MRRCLRELRALPSGVSELDVLWLEALEALKRLPEPPPRQTARSEEAHRLCLHLQGALARLEGTPRVGLDADEAGRE
jgi:hypothetical protein